MANISSNKTKSQFPFSIFITIFIFLFWGIAFPQIVEGGNAYGWVTLTGDDWGTDTTCGTGGSLIDFSAREYNTETPVTVDNIAVEIRQKSNHTLLWTASGTPLTNAVCIDVYNHYASITVDGDPDYEDFFGNYEILDPQSWKQKRLTAHIHLKAKGAGFDARHVSPTNNWLQTEPSYQVEVSDFTSLHGANALYNIQVEVRDEFFTLVAEKEELLTEGAGTGTYTIPPFGTLPDGLYYWTFYVGLNGGTPSPISSLPQPDPWEWFGIDRADPVNVSASHSPPNPVNGEPVVVTGEGQDELSGLDWIEVWVDGGLVRKCEYDGETSLESCSTFPQSYSVGDHSYYAIVQDLAGNTVQSTPLGSFTVSSGPFGYSLSSSDVEINEGGSIANFIVVTLTSGTTQEVILSHNVDTAVPGATGFWLFGQDRCSPDCQPRLAIDGGTASSGTYEITVTGQPLGRTTTFNLIITEPSDFDYSLSNDGDISVITSMPGGNLITITNITGTPEEVTLNVTERPNTTVAWPDGNSCTPDPVCSLRLRLTDTVEGSGTYPITVTGDPLGRTTNFNLIVNDSAFNYNISNSGDIIIVASGESDSVTITVRITSFEGTVVFRESGLPEGATAYWPDGNNCYIHSLVSKSCAKTLTINSGTAQGGVYPITVTGQPWNRTTTFNLYINDPPVADAGVAISPDGVSCSGVTYLNSITVPQGAEVPICFSAEETDLDGDGQVSDDPNDWDNPIIGVFECAWNSNLNAGFFIVDEQVDNPPSPSDCNIGPRTVTFDTQPLGTNEYKVLVIQDIPGVYSNTATVYITVTENESPTATNLNVTDFNGGVLSQEDYCSEISPPIRFNWTFSDDGTQSAYQVQIDDDSDFDDPGDPTPPWGCPNSETGKVTSSDEFCLASPLNDLDFGLNYWWRVKVWDDKNVPSDWATTGQPFHTLPRPPWPDFTWDPQRPTPDTEVQFCSVAGGVCPTDLTTCYDADNTCNNWAWDFKNDGIDDIVGSTPAEQNPIWTYTTEGDYSAQLTVTDDNGNCSITKDLNVLLLPEWKEILPPPPAQ